LTDDDLTARLREELGIREPRRVVRADGRVIVLSKLAAGESKDLFAAVEALPELFDAAVIAGEYERLRLELVARGEAPLRSAVWRMAVESLLDRLVPDRGIEAARRLITPGIESVQAALDAVLWSAPSVASDDPPVAAEREALRELLSAADRDLFTRYYGEVDGRRVESYCPGAPYARRLLETAFAVCSGSDRPLQ
jgi:hypothetical protein